MEYITHTKPMEMNRFHSCHRLLGKLGSKVKRSTKNRSCSVDLFGLVGILKQQNKVFCTPRCHVTRSWEVGLSQEYMVTYLIGSEYLTSFDFRVLQTMEIIQLFLHALEIQEQSGPRFEFFIPFCRSDGGRKFKRCSYDAGDNLNNSLIILLNRMCIQLRIYLNSTSSEVSSTQLIADLDMVREIYFRDYHLNFDLKAGSEHRIILRLLGRLHGIVKSRSKEMQLIYRHYYLLGARTGQVNMDFRIFLLFVCFRMVPCMEVLKQ